MIKVYSYVMSAMLPINSKHIIFANCTAQRCTYNKCASSYYNSNSCALKPPLVYLASLLVKFALYLLPTIHGILHTN